jgi:nicotinate-nucleotide pyrophosphorylase (carboxylating)
MSVERLASVAATGVDYVSMGSLTHSAPAADLALAITQS